MKKIIIALTFLFLTGFSQSFATELNKNGTALPINDNRTITQIDHLNLYIETELGQPPKLLFNYELPPSSVYKDKTEPTAQSRLSEFTGFDAIMLSTYSDLYKISKNKEGGMEIKDREEVILIPRKVLENPSPIDIPSYPTTNLSNFDNASFDIKVIETLHKDKTDYFLLRAKYIGKGSNGVCGAAPDESIRLLSISSDGDMKISSGFPYYSCYGLSDGGVLVYARHAYYIFSDYRNIMVFDKTHPEWGFLVRELSE